VDELRPLTQYEMEQVKAIKEWKQEAPGVASRSIGLATYPATWLIQKIIPSAAIRGALDMANWAASGLADKGDILRDGGVMKIADLHSKSLEACDRLADDVHNWAIGLAAAEGGVTGATGVLGTVVDLPAIITLALRTIPKIGCCYGYECNDDLGKNFVLGILPASGANSMEEKVGALALLRSIEVTIAKQTWKAIAEKAAGLQFSKGGAVLFIKNLAKQLGINITKRKALQVIPAIGAGVGASVNGWYIKEVGWAARWGFQERWLIDHRKLFEI
jgi:EcsC protein family